MTQDDLVEKFTQSFKSNSGHASLDYLSFVKSELREVYNMK